MGSPHDFSATGPWTQSGDISPSGVCSGCHIPHGAQDNALWSRNLLGYRTKLYHRDGSPGTEPNFLLPPSLACYDCHDYHGTADFENPSTPALSLFRTDHRPHDVLFGFRKDSLGSMTEFGPGPQGGKAVPGFYETNPPGPAASYGVNTSAPLNETGGHYFKNDPTSSAGDAIDNGDKLPCRDCHDPHQWDSGGNWQAFFRKQWPPGSRVATRLGATAVGSSQMANDSTPVNKRSDVGSRNLCIACHGTSDTQPVNFSEIDPSYRSAPITAPPATVGEHANASQVACVTCHAHNSIGANCSGCHGFPPGPYPPDRQSAQSPPYPSAEPHSRHVGRADGQPPGSTPPYSFECKVCHATSAMGSRGSGAAHQDNVMSIAFDLSGLGQPNPPDNSLSVGQSGIWCSNVYCHSAGGSDNSLAGYFSPVRWGYSPAPLRCNGCHGRGTPDNVIETGMPNYASGPAGSATANSHNVHVVVNRYDCSVCHFDTAQGSYATGRSVKTAPLKHVNGAREVVFDGTTATGTFDNTPATKTCHVSCHGLDAPRWGGTLVSGCFSCHTGTEQTHKPQNDYGTPGAPNPVDNAEYLYSGHGRSGSNYAGSNNLPAGFSRYVSDNTAPADCYLCHSQNAAHTVKDANDPFRLGYGSDTTGQKGTLKGAFADNTDALCLGCHGDATQRGGHDNAAKGTTTINVKTHARGITGTRYNWPVTPWKCVDCHDPHGDGKSGADRYMMVRSGINAPIDNTDANAGSDAKSRPKRTDANVRGLTFNSLAGYATGSYAQPGNGTGGTWGPCEVCHTQTTAYSRTSDNTASHAARTSRCTSCHGHGKGFAPTACKGCHGPDGVAPSAPDISAYWTSSGHGRFASSSECESCHDASYLTAADHKTDGSVPGNPPNNINTLDWPGKSPRNADTNPNANTSHLKSGFINASPTSRADIAKTFDNYCTYTCHSREYHRHQKDAGPLPRDVMRFGDPGTDTTSNPKQYNWYALTTYATDFYRSQSPWVDSDVRSSSGLPDQGTEYGLCVSCHDPHGTGTTDTSGGYVAHSNHMVRGNWKSDAGTFCTRACHTSRTPP